MNEYLVKQIAWITCYCVLFLMCQTVVCVRGVYDHEKVTKNVLFLAEKSTENCTSHKLKYEAEVQDKIWSKKIVPDGANSKQPLLCHCIVLFCFRAAPLSKIAQLQTPHACSFNQSLLLQYIFVYYLLKITQNYLENMDCVIPFFFSPNFYSPVLRFESQWAWFSLSTRNFIIVLVVKTPPIHY